MKKLWRILIMIVAFPLLLWGGRMTAQATVTTGTFNDTDGDGQVLSWSYDDESKTLTISGTGELGEQLKNAPFSTSMRIRKVIFENCRVMGSMRWAFGGLFGDTGICIWGDVEEFDFSGLDTSQVTDMSGMFYNCIKLVSIDMSGLNTSKVTDMSAMFAHCSSLKELDLSSFDTANVTSMSSMFTGCSSLKELDLSSFDTANVTSMYGMFWEAKSLEQIDVSSFNTAKVTTMHTMFNQTLNLNLNSRPDYIEEAVGGFIPMAA